MDTSATDDSDASAKTFKSFSFHSVSSSSEISSEDEFINVKPKLTLPIPVSVSPDNVQHPKPDHLSNPNVINSKVKPVKPNQSVYMSVPVVMESPVVQMMERPPPGFDPNRIPQSVFVSKSSGPTDWSVASTESLFSIRIGNNSFEDHVVSVPEETSQIGECEVSEEEPESDSPANEVRQRESAEEEFMEVESRISQQEEITGDGTITSVGHAEAQTERSNAKLPFPELSFKHHANGARMKPKIKIKKRSSEFCCSGCTCEFCCSIKLSCCFCKWPRCDCCELSKCENMCTWPSCKFPSCKCPTFKCFKRPNCDHFCSFKCCKLPSCDNFCSFKCCKWPSFGNCCSSKCCEWPSCNSCCSFKCCEWPSCGNCCSCNSCKWPSCDSCCQWPACGGCKGCKLHICGCCGECSNCCKWPSCKCCKWPTCSSCSDCSKWPTCGSCKNCCRWPTCGSCSDSCKWPSCSCQNCCQWPTCGGCSGCCKWLSCSCKNCCNWPTCGGCSGCCKWPSFNCFKGCSCTSCCKWPTCSGPRGCCKLPSCSCGFQSCKWRCIFCCFRKPQRSHRQSRRSRQTCSWFSSIFCCSNC